MFDKLKINIRQAVEVAKLKSKRNKELRELNKEEKFEIEVQQLDNQIELEQRRAELRGLKSVNIPLTPTKQSGVKGAFEKFQDFATDFAQNQQKQMKVKIPGGKRNARTYKI